MSSFKYRRLDRNEVEGLATLFANHLPSYRCLITSYAAGAASRRA